MTSSRIHVGRCSITGRAVPLAGLVVLVAGLVGPAGATPVAPGLSIRPELAQILSKAGPDEPVLVLASSTSAAAATRAATRAGMAIVEPFPRLDMIAAVGSGESIEALHRQPEIARVDANLALEPLDDSAHRATGIAQLRDHDSHPTLNRLRGKGRTPYDGTGVSIAVLDTGFERTHEAFVVGGESKFDVHLRQACSVEREGAYTFTGLHAPECSAWVPAPATGDDLLVGHGTAVAAIAAGYPHTTSRGSGVSGTAPGARLVGLSVGYEMYDVASGLNWVLEHHDDPCGDGSCPSVRVVNISFGLPSEDDIHGRGFDPNSPIARLTTDLVEAGVIVVFGAGNSESSTHLSPFARHPLPGVISVGGFTDLNTGDRLGKRYGSSVGVAGDVSTYPDLVAPSDMILTACPSKARACLPIPAEDGHGYMSGTSASAPYVSGVVAQLFEAGPSLAPADIEDILEDSAFQGFIEPGLLEPDVFTDADGDVRGNDNHFTSFHVGHGLIDVVGALSLIRPGRTEVAPDPCPERDTEAATTDARGDTNAFLGVDGVPGEDQQPGRDIVELSANLTDNPGAMTVVVSFDDLAEVEPRLRTTVEVLIDGRYAIIDQERSAAGDDPAFVFSGDVTAEAVVDPGAEKITFVIRPREGTIQQRAGVALAYTEIGIGRGGIDLAGGICHLWMPNEG